MFDSNKKKMVDDNVIGVVGSDGSVLQSGKSLPLSRLLRPFFVINAVVSWSMLVGRGVVDALAVIDGATVPMEDLNLFGALGIWLVVRYRSCLSLEEFLAKTYWIGQISTGILLFLHQLNVLPFYILLVVVVILVMHIPSYDGPGHVLQLTPEIHSQINDSSSNVIWIIHAVMPETNGSFYSAPFFAELSLRYASSHLKFAQLDILQFPEIALEFKVSSKNVLPVFLVVKNGKITNRLPRCDEEGNDIPIVLTQEKIIKGLGIVELHLEVQRLLFKSVNGNHQTKARSAKIKH